METDIKRSFKLKTRRALVPDTKVRPDKAISFKAKVWIYNGPAAWHFITLPKSLSHRIKMDFGLRARGWGSLPVKVSCGSSKWSTSIFPDSKAGAYLLPLKAGIRKKENLLAKKTYSFSLVVGD